MANESLPNGITIKLSELPACAGGVSRRGFCAAAGAGLVTLGLAACDPGASRVGLGEVGGGPGGGVGGGGGGGNDEVDASVGGGGKDAGVIDGPHDLSTTSNGHPDMTSTTGPQPDLSHPAGGNCPSGMVNAGLASAVAVGDAKYFSSNDFFLCRDAGGLFALTSICPHAGCTIQNKTTKLYCPCHAAAWTMVGARTAGPVPTTLDHLAVCIDASGNALVNVNSTVGASTRV